MAVPIGKPQNGKQLVVASARIGGVQITSVSLRQSSLTEPIFDDVHRKHPRAAVGGNKSMETLVDRNYALLLREVKRVIREGVESREINDERNTVADMMKRCLDQQNGLHPGDFTTTKGKPMNWGRSFGYMVKQLFRDADMIRNLFWEVHFELAAKR